MPMITSSEIKNSTFDHVSFRGYNPDQVDKVLDNAAETIDSLSRENAILNEKLHALTSQVEVLRQREASLNEDLKSGALNEYFRWCFVRQLRKEGRVCKHQER